MISKLLNSLTNLPLKIDNYEFDRRSKSLQELVADRYARFVHNTNYFLQFSEDLTPENAEAKVEAFNDKYRPICGVCYKAEVTGNIVKIKNIILQQEMNLILKFEEDGLKVGMEWDRYVIVRNQKSFTDASESEKCEFLDNNPACIDADFNNVIKVYNNARIAKNQFNKYYSNSQVTTSNYYHTDYKARKFSLYKEYCLAYEVCGLDRIGQAETITLTDAELTDASNMLLGQKIVIEETYNEEYEIENEDEESELKKIVTYSNPYDYPFTVTCRSHIQTSNFKFIIQSDCQGILYEFTDYDTASDCLIDLAVEERESSDEDDDYTEIEYTLRANDMVLLSSTDTIVQDIVDEIC